MPTATHESMVQTFLAQHEPARGVAPRYVQRPATPPCTVRPKRSPFPQLTAQGVAEVLTDPWAAASYLVQGTDRQGWALFAAWCRGQPLTWGQFQRMAWMFRALLELSPATPQEQDEAAASFGQTPLAEAVQPTADGPRLRPVNVAVLLRAARLAGGLRP